MLKTKISTSSVLNDIMWRIDKAFGGKFRSRAIDILYFYYRNFPPKCVIDSKKYFESNKEEVDKVVGMLSDDESRKIYQAMIQFRGSFDMRIHPGITKGLDYFDESIVKLSDKEVFIDCGAFTGDTITDFIKVTGSKFTKVIAFEPDEVNYDALKKYYENDARIIPIKKGVYKKNDVLRFKGDGNSGSRVDLDGNVSIEVTAIDENEICKDATFIKMDIEGAETEALLGAEKIIKNNRPVLAI